MATRSERQKTGSRGHRWVMSEIEEHSDWIARDQGEDFGIDAEIELSQPEVVGELVKLQFKSSESVEHADGKVGMTVERKYLHYANTCRYPVVFVRIDVGEKKAWYLWLQRWLLEQRLSGGPLDWSQGSWKVWVDESQSLHAGLSGELKDVARWRTEVQLALSMKDALHAAAASMNRDSVDHVIAALASLAPSLAPAYVDLFVEEAVRLGQNLWGTSEGNAIAQVLYSLAIRFGDALTTTTVDALVRRADSYSRTGVNVLSKLYDEHFERTAALGLVDHFTTSGLPRVGYLCALRERYPDRTTYDFHAGGEDLVHAGLGFGFPPEQFFLNKLANRGASAILDYLVVVDEAALNAVLPPDGEQPDQPDH